MILIEDEWYKVYDLSDISKIIREHYNPDLANEMDKLIPEHSDADYKTLEMKLEDKKDYIASLEDKLDTLENKVEILEEKIEELEERDWEENDG